MSRTLKRKTIKQVASYFVELSDEMLCKAKALMDTDIVSSRSALRLNGK